MTGERFVDPAGQDNTGEHQHGNITPAITPDGSEERAYVLRGNLPPNTWRTLVKQLGFAFDIKLEQIDYETYAATQTGEHDLPEGEDDEAKAEKAIVLNRKDFDKFAKDNGFAKPLAGKAWNALARLYDRKARIRNQIYQGPNQEDYAATPIEFSGIPSRYTETKPYYDLRFETLVELMQTVEKHIGGNESPVQICEAFKRVNMYNVGAKTLEFYRALVKHYTSEEDQPDQAQS